MTPISSWLLTGSWLFIAIVVGLGLAYFITDNDEGGIDIKPSIGGIVDDETDVPPK